MPSSKALFIDPDVSNFISRPTFQTSCHGAIHDPVNTLPVQSQQHHCLLHTGRCLKDLNRKGLKHQRESTVRLGPRNIACADTAPGTFCSRNSGYDDSGKLHRIQMTPLPFRSVILQRTGLTALAADGFGTRGFQMNFNLRRLQLHIHFDHTP